MEWFQGGYGRVHNNILKNLPCVCPVCNQIKDIKILTINDYKSACLRTLHNLYQYIQYAHFINSIKDDLNLLREYITQTRNKISNDLLDFIEYSYNNTAEEGIKKYSHLFKQPQTGKQCTINF